MAEAMTYNRLLEEVLTVEGVLNAGFRAFHKFSLGNQIAASLQLMERGIPLTPIASFNAWKEKGRTVKKGAKAVALCMPVTCKGKEKEGAAEGEQAATFSRFIWRNNWFVMSETEGAEYVHDEKTPAWNADKALTVLDIVQIPFEGTTNGNRQGFAKGREIAINELATFPHKTRFHEIAHVVMGHTEEAFLEDSDKTPRNVIEAEAEAVAFILCSLLGFSGLPESRHYVQSYLEGEALPERSAQRIFNAANTILKAGEI